jgi:hypothetical protein
LVDENNAMSLSRHADRSPWWGRWRARYCP